MEDDRMEFEEIGDVLSKIAFLPSSNWRANLRIV
jgi:hypothetical protein